EYHVDVRRAGHDGLAFLARHAAAHADHQPRLALLQLARAAEVGNHLLLRLLADRAGVEEHDVGFVDVARALDALGLGEQVRHPVRVVLVHLAAEGLDEELAGHEPLARCPPGRAPALRWPGWLRRANVQSPPASDHRIDGRARRVCGGGSGTRTPDLRIMIPSL